MVLFPHDSVRPIQDRLLKAVIQSVQDRTNLIVHAPTGLGKTAASIAPALTNALDDTSKVVFFLTSRHMQHKIALDTLLRIKARHDVNFSTADIIGKKWFCIQPNVHRMRPMEFYEYCNNLRDDRLCEYYENLRKNDKPSPESLNLMKYLKQNNPLPTEQVIEACRQHKLCPYEVALMLAKISKVIVTDYFYLFNAHIRNSFLKKIGKSLDDCIMIVDEAHNLPHRVKDLNSIKLTSVMLSRALSEAKKQDRKDIIKVLNQIGMLLERLQPAQGEMYLKSEDVVEPLQKFMGYDEMVGMLNAVGAEIREKQQYSYIGSVGLFLEQWTGQDQGYTRILQRSDNFLSLKYQCLDPSIITDEVINNTASTILMSGTLTPTEMYRELLGVKNAEELTLPSPFPEKNRLNLIIPRTSTKYENRNPEQYKNIAGILSDVVEGVPGNSLIFFPSYYLRNEIARHVVTSKVTFNEEPKMSKGEKDELLERFKKCSDDGAVLYAVTSGNFGEGVDLPGDFLKAVVIVGLPLQKPDLETKALIDYFQGKYGKGWEYGYIFPAFTKTIQSAGRCIRSEKDKGIVVFLDERYTWKNYYRCFPESWQIKISHSYTEEIENFFQSV